MGREQYVATSPAKTRMKPWAVEVINEVINVLHFGKTNGT